MKTLAQTLTPRASTLDRSYKDLVLDLSDLEKTDPARFFSETYVTKGMRDLHEAVFKRLEGSSQDGTFKLTQAMGGGKTHTMVTVGLMAMYPEHRGSIEGLYASSFRESARVVAFTGRNTPKGGIAGHIAAKLGKTDLISERLAKGEALDQTDWIRLLDGPPTLIMLDELPPYFAYLHSQGTGGADPVTRATYELSNLLNALNKSELSNVALVISDLDSGWEQGSESLRSIVDNLDKESNRSAKPFEPVRQNSNEIYEILKKRLFENADTSANAKAVAEAYREEVRKAAKQELTRETPERIADGIEQSYPFHPSLRDVYARFKENPGFQQTRGLIRLMRAVVTRMYDEQAGWADSSYLIHPYDFDPNDEAVGAELGKINGKLTNALSNDIASDGQAAAERIDAELDTKLASKLARLLYASSLSVISTALRGLPESEYMAFLAAPGNDLSQVKANVLPKLRESSWYLHADKSGRLLYRNVQNVSAKIDTYRKQLNLESVRAVVADKLEELFAPVHKDVYQQLYVLKPVDEIAANRDKVSLVVYQPHTGGELHPDLQALYDNAEFKNRLLFLTGDKLGIDTVNDRARYLTAADLVLKEFREENMPTNDPQFQEAGTQRDTALHGLNSAVASVFTKVYIPTKPGLVDATIGLNFGSGQGRSGEEQIRTLLEEKRKFTTDVTSDAFMRQLQAKLIGGPRTSTKWSEVLRKAATNTSWPLHKPDALEQAKVMQLERQNWKREGDSHIKTGPFDKPPTSVVVRELNDATLVRDSSGPITLLATPQRADKVYYAYDRDTVTPESGKELKSPFHLDIGDSMRVSFIAVDSTGVHETGAPVLYERPVVLLHELDQQGESWRVELQASPANAEIRYTDDGSDPRQHGSTYADTILAPPKALVQAYAIRGGVESEVHTISIPALGEQGYQIDEERPATYQQKLKVGETSQSYALVSLLQKYEATSCGVEVLIELEDAQFAVFSCSDRVGLNGEQVQQYLDKLQEFNTGQSQLSLKLDSIRFASGRAFKAFAQEQGLEYQNKHVDQ